MTLNFQTFGKDEVPEIANDPKSAKNADDLLLSTTNSETNVPPSTSIDIDVDLDLGGVNDGRSGTRANFESKKILRDSDRYHYEWNSSRSERDSEHLDQPRYSRWRDPVDYSNQRFGERYRSRDRAPGVGSTDQDRLWQGR